MEIERKFLLREAPEWLAECRPRRLEQGYLALTDEAEVRVRLIDDGREARLTVKRGRGRDREETEVELVAEQAGLLWPATEGRRVCKRRYRCEREQGVFEVDVYEGELEGLVTCEIEFESTEAAERFETPDWIGEEVTEDAGYKNRALAVDGRPPAAVGD